MLFKSLNFLVFQPPYSRKEEISWLKISGKLRNCTGKGKIRCLPLEILLFLPASHGNAKNTKMVWNAESWRWEKQLRDNFRCCWMRTQQESGIILCRAEGKDSLPVPCRTLIPLLRQRGGSDADPERFSTKEEKFYSLKEFSDFSHFNFIHSSFAKKKSKHWGLCFCKSLFIHLPVQKGFLVSFSRSRSLNLSFSPTETVKMWMFCCFSAFILVFFNHNS